MYIFIQQGDSGGEFYVHVHDDLASAREHMVSCRRATYRTSTIVDVPDSLDLDALQTVVETGIGYEDWMAVRQVLTNAGRGVVKVPEAYGGPL